MTVLEDPTTSLICPEAGGLGGYDLCYLYLDSISLAISSIYIILYIISPLSVHIRFIFKLMSCVCFPQPAFFLSARLSEVHKGLQGVPGSRDYTKKKSTLKP